MLTRDYVERELSHIQKMVAMLESDSGTKAYLSGAARVSCPSYWRGRIEALLSTPDMPRHARKISETLLVKIDGMEARFAARASARR
ncbi:hypothetical protein WL15_24575 [Burkholderia multivorans]|uniref:hypothetical protein n=1 Tax=Burkholderia multivorans TaxID=87883 RepID=UPI000752821A|nr:hypothetical protein [Burkholderia multivorans]KVZ24034.1 hypothetical protein WL15_24575 [Burkholderia multivorans]